MTANHAALAWLLVPREKVACKCHIAELPGYWLPAIWPKLLWVRVYHCPACDLVIESRGGMVRDTYRYSTRLPQRRKKA